MKKHNGWDCHDNGDIAVGPLLGWTMKPIPMTILVRLETSSSPDLSPESLKSVQLAMTGAQARELATALQSMAIRLDRQPLGTQQ